MRAAPTRSRRPARRDGTRGRAASPPGAPPPPPSRDVAARRPGAPGRLSPRGRRGGACRARAAAGSRRRCARRSRSARRPACRRRADVRRQGRGVDGDPGRVVGLRVCGSVSRSAETSRTAAPDPRHGAAPVGQQVDLRLEPGVDLVDVGGATRASRTRASAAGTRSRIGAPGSMTPPGGLGLRSTTVPATGAVTVVRPSLSAAAAAFLTSASWRRVSASSFATSSARWLPSTTICCRVSAITCRARAIAAWAVPPRAVDPARARSSASSRGFARALGEELLHARDSPRRSARAADRRSPISAWWPPISASPWRDPLAPAPPPGRPAPAPAGEAIELARQQPRQRGLGPRRSSSSGKRPRPRRPARPSSRASAAVSARHWRAGPRARPGAGVVELDQRLARRHRARRP